MRREARRFPKAGPIRSPGCRARVNCGPTTPTVTTKRPSLGNGTRRPIFHGIGSKRASPREAPGKALSQLMTFLTEVEMIATDTPATWLPRLNPDFIEVKSFIAAQVM